MTDPSHDLGWHLAPPLIGAVVNPIIGEWVKRGAGWAHVIPESGTEAKVRKIQRKLGFPAPASGGGSSGDDRKDENLEEILQSMKNRLSMPGPTESLPIPTQLENQLNALSVQTESIQNNLALVPLVFIELQLMNKRLKILSLISTRLRLLERWSKSHTPQQSVENQLPRGYPSNPLRKRSKSLPSRFESIDNPLHRVPLEQDGREHTKGVQKLE